jgi:hypothetical protein
MAQPTVTSAPKTFGLLSIIFSSLVLASSLFGTFGLFVPALLARAPTQNTSDAETLHALSGIYFTMGICSCIFLVMSALLLTLGIGQMRYRQWAAVWTPRWGIAALGALAVMATLMISMGRSTGAEMATVAQTGNTAAAQNVGSAVGGIYAVMMVLFYAPYPIVLLVAFTRARIRAAMTA